MIEKGNITGSGSAVKTPIEAVGLGCRAQWGRDAFETSSRNLVNLRKYLRVVPETPQSVAWVVPGNELTYHVESNTDWILK